MSVRLFSQNLLESAESITVQPPANADKPMSRLYDRDRGPKAQWGNNVAWGMPVAFVLPLAMTVPTETRIHIDLGESLPASAIAFINNLFSGTITVYGDDNNPPTTVQATIPALPGTNIYAEFNEVEARYWDIVIPSIEPSFGEILLGVPRTIDINPSLANAGARTVGNVARDRSRGGYLWSSKKGQSRARLAWGWNALTTAEKEEIEAAFAETNEGEKKLVVVDEFDVVRWMDWLDDGLDPIPVKGGTDDEDRLYSLKVLLEEAL